MVLKKRMSYGSRGYYLPAIPHIPNSAKGKRTVRRNLVSNPFGAFDLLATIAGKLLTGGETGPVSLNGAPNCSTSKLDTVKKEPKTETLDQISTNDSGIVVSNLKPIKTLIEKSGTKQEEDDNNNNDDGGLVRSNSSNSSSEMPLYSGRLNPNPNPNLFLEKHVYRDDDDENSSNKSFKLRNNLSVKKSFIAKLRKVASRTNDENKTKCYTRKRTQKTMFKRKALFDRCSDGELYNKEVKKRTLLKTGNQKQQAYENHVKLSIKSFKVPELFIEISESATISTLKKMVMEAVTAVLEGELKVGVMLQGQKVRDGTKTLKQVGIYQNATGMLDTLNFSLEPQLSVPHASCETDDIMEPLASIAPTVILSQDKNTDTIPVPVPVPTTPVKSHVSDPEPVQVHSPMEVSSASPMSQAIVPVLAVKAEPLEMVPLARKSRQAEMLGQRRIRRPFSVSEVEALVSAVEQLGTGRWRDVKIRAFADAKHRTYVDLKDKWKTLVHTASIAPQQRRGQPVPQELLDRVLSAQAYWAHQHSKLHAKSAFNGEPGLAILDSSPSSIEKIIALESN